MENLYEWWQEKDERVKKGVLMVGIGVLLLCVGIFYYRSQSSYLPINQLVSQYESSSSLEPEQSSEEEMTSTEPTLIYIDIKGAIKYPNVYALPYGSRLFDLIEEAGGFLPEAHTNSVNQAQLLSDQMLIYIYTQEEWESQHDNATVVVNTESARNENHLVNINKADVSELQQLPGIGKGKAEAIVTYRQENGSFNNIEELQQVKGIGTSTFEKLASLITVSP